MWIQVEKKNTKTELENMAEVKTYGDFGVFLVHAIVESGHWLLFVL